jgi:Ca2+-binding RTX toxin-like protein
MPTTVTVPGANNTAIPNPYGTPQNLAIAQQISNMLFNEQQNSNLHVAYSDQNPGTPPDGYVGELAVTVPGGGSVTLPGGYSITAIDQTVTDPVTVNGGGSLFVGNTPVTYYGASSPAPVLVAAGDGTDLFSLPQGQTYNVAAGSGQDSFYANGSGTVTGGSGDNLFFAGNPTMGGGNNIVNSYGGADTIIAGEGAVTVSSYGADPVVWGGSGPLIFYGEAAGNPTVYGGTGQETLYGGAGENLTYLDGNTSTTGANILAAGAGNETLNAGGATYGVRLAAGSGSDSLIGSTGNDTFYGGAGTATMTGNGGSDIFMFGNSAGASGGTSIITDFNSNDIFEVTGYGANAAQNALSAATVTGSGSNATTTVQLADNTTIVFLHVSDPSTIQNQSFV